MTIYKIGEIECTATQLSSGKFQASIFVARSEVLGRAEHRHVMQGLYSASHDALEAAKAYVQEHFPEGR